MPNTFHCISERFKKQGTSKKAAEKGQRSKLSDTKITILRHIFNLPALSRLNKMYDIIRIICAVVFLIFPNRLKTQKNMEQGSQAGLIHVSQGPRQVFDGRDVSKRCQD